VESDIDTEGMTGCKTTRDSSMGSRACMRAVSGVEEKGGMRCSGTDSSYCGEVVGLEPCGLSAILLTHGPTNLCFFHPNDETFTFALLLQSLLLRPDDSHAQRL